MKTIRDAYYADKWESQKGEEEERERAKAKPLNKEPKKGSLGPDDPMDSDEKAMLGFECL